MHANDFILRHKSSSPFCALDFHPSSSNPICMCREWEMKVVCVCEDDEMEQSNWNREHNSEIYNNFCLLLAFLFSLVRSFYWHHFHFLVSIVVFHSSALNMPRNYSLSLSDVLVHRNFPQSFDFTDIFVITSPLFVFTLLAVCSTLQCCVFWSEQKGKQKNQK